MLAAIHPFLLYWPSILLPTLGWRCRVPELWYAPGASHAAEPGCSATVAVLYGAIADVATAADRCGMVGIAMIATNLGPVIAPIIGGGILTTAR
jgi:MFS family permease